MKPTALFASVVALATGAVTVLTAPTSYAAPAADAAASAAPVPLDRCLDSRPEPGTTEKVKICFTLFRPAGATADAKVPMIVHGHGWGGRRVRDPQAFAQWLDAGYGVVSFDQRGFGESTGKAHLQNPSYEGRDIAGLVHHIAKLPWVQLDGPGDPRLGAIGGSYGGGFQFLGAFNDLTRNGRPIFDALAPEITWNDLRSSLAPEDTFRTRWASLLLLGGARALPPEIVTAWSEAIATGAWPTGAEAETIGAFFARTGPSWQVEQGRRLSIPVLIGQGVTDNLFPLEQGFTNFETALTRRARKRSMLVGYNGGHVLPAINPPGAVTSNSDPCSAELAGGGFAQLALRFMDEQLRGRDTGLRGYGRYHLATSGGECTTVRSVRATRSFRVPSATSDEAAGRQSVRIVRGPIRIAGRAHLRARVRTSGDTARAFVGLSVGTSPEDAKLISNNVLPIVDDSRRGLRRIPLPAGAADVAKGQSLFLTISPVSDDFGGSAAQTPGTVSLSRIRAWLPVVRR